MKLRNKKTLVRFSTVSYKNELSVSSLNKIKFGDFGSKWSRWSSRKYVLIDISGSFS